MTKARIVSTCTLLAMEYNGDGPSSRMSALPDFFGGGIFGLAGCNGGVAIAARATVMSGIDGDGARDMALAI